MDRSGILGIIGWPNQLTPTELPMYYHVRMQRPATAGVAEDGQICQRCDDTAVHRDLPFTCPTLAPNQYTRYRAPPPRLCGTCHRGTRA